MNFKDRLIQAMNEKKIKASELANKTNIDKASISNYISGNYMPKQDKLYKIAKVLNVSPVWLMGYNVEKNTNEMISNKDKQKLTLYNAIVDLSSTSKEKELLFKCTQLNENRKQVVIEYVNLLLKEQGYFEKDEFGDLYDPMEDIVYYKDI